MKCLWMLFFILFALMISSVQAQEGTDRLSFSAGLNSTRWKSPVSATSPIYSTPVLTMEAGVTLRNLKIRNTFRTGWDRFGGSANDISTELDIISLGPIKLGLAGRYFSDTEKDIIWDHDNLLIAGTTRKRYFFTGLTSGAGTRDQKNFRVTVMACATDIRKHIRIFSENRELEGSPTLVDDDLLPAIFIGGTLTWPDIWKKVSLEASVSNIRTVYIRDLERENTKKIIPPSQIIIRTGARMPLNGWLSAGADAEWSNTSGMIFLGNSASLKLMISH